jgi:hypothetical protein
MLAALLWLDSTLTHSASRAHRRSIWYATVTKAKLRLRDFGTIRNPGARFGGGLLSLRAEPEE